jgi:hypothetical protein
VLLALLFFFDSLLAPFLAWSDLLILFSLLASAQCQARENV